MLAQASANHDLLWAAIIPACLAFIMGGVTVFISWSNHRAARAIDKMTRNTNEKAQSIGEQVEPENGMRLGQLVEQVAKTAEAIDARVYDGSKRTDRLERTMDRVEDKIDNHIEATAPLGVKFKEMLKKKEE